MQASSSRLVYTDLKKVLVSQVVGVLFCSLSAPHVTPIHCPCATWRAVELSLEVQA